MRVKGQAVGERKWSLVLSAAHSVAGWLTVYSWYWSGTAPWGHAHSCDKWFNTFDQFYITVVSTTTEISKEIPPQGCWCNWFNPRGSWQPHSTLTNHRAQCSCVYKQHSVSWALLLHSADLQSAESDSGELNNRNKSCFSQDHLLDRLTQLCGQPVF